MIDVDKRTSRAGTLTVYGIGVLGLVVGGIATLYIAGAFGLSTATAANLVTAFEVGGWALTIALAAFSAGTAAGILAVMRAYAAQMTRRALIA